VAKPKLWAIKLLHGSEDCGYLNDHGRVVAVYDTENNAEKDAKWLNEFHKKTGSKTIYQTVRFREEQDFETALQTEESMPLSKNYAEKSPPPKKSEEKKLKRPTPEYSEAAPRPTILSDLSGLFTGSLDTDGTL
jgi:NADH dehydrogenase/NADH:ubiquinone oxidoreductase subunit G